MVKKGVLLVFLFFALVVFSGCETAGGMGKGVACGVGSTVEGAGKDVYNTGGALQTIDSWIRKNMW